MKKGKIFSNIISVTILSLLIMSNIVKADIINTDILYKNAYNATQKALTERTQKSVNIARIEIKKLPKNMAWAIGEFSKKVDTVQHPILVNIVNCIKKAEKEPNQTNINNAKASIPIELNPVFKNSYSSAVDSIQQKIQATALELVKNAEEEKTQESIDKALVLIEDIKTSTSPSLVNWANTLLERVKVIDIIIDQINPDESVIIREKPILKVDWSKVTSDTIVTFKDPIVEKAVRDTINKPQGNITYKDALKVQSINLPGSGVTSIHGLEYCRNIVDINLGYRYYAEMIKNPDGSITYGRFSYNYITDISPLQYMPSLHSVNIGYNTGIQDISYLSKAINMYKLILGETSVKDISIIKNFKKLNRLQLSEYAMKDLSVLNNLPIHYLFIDISNEYNKENNKYLQSLNELEYMAIDCQKGYGEEYANEIKILLPKVEVDINIYSGKWD